MYPGEGNESLVFPVISFDSERKPDSYTGKLVRFYIGLDEADSLINDLDQAFEIVRKSR